MTRLPRPSVRYVPLVVLAAVALLVPAGPASADSPPVVDLNCTTTVTTHEHPGVSPDAHTFSVSSHGLTGTSTCTGTINGEPVTGPGAFGVNEAIFGTPNPCVSSTGHGTFILKIPTAGGTRTVTGQFDLLSSAATGTVHTGDLTGTSHVIAANGDCVNTPVTESTAVLVDHVT